VALTRRLRLLGVRAGSLSRSDQPPEPHRPGRTGRIDDEGSLRLFD
jgi:hypothetical protein